MCNTKRGVNGFHLYIDHTKKRSIKREIAIATIIKYVNFSYYFHYDCNQNSVVLVKEAYMSIFYGNFYKQTQYLTAVDNCFIVIEYKLSPNITV